jgi:hypothetical protein
VRGATFYGGGGCNRTFFPPLRVPRQCPRFRLAKGTLKEGIVLGNEEGKRMEGGLCYE